MQATVVAAGFIDFEITWRADVFSGAPQSSSASSFDTVGINFRARKARHSEGTGQGLHAAMESLACDLPHRRK